MISDVKMKRVAATGSLAVGPARIRGVHCKVATGTPRLVISDGSGGADALDVDFHSANQTVTVHIPDGGIRVEDIYVKTLTNVTALTVFYS